MVVLHQVFPSTIQDFLYPAEQGTTDDDLRLHLVISFGVSPPIVFRQERGSFGPMVALGLKSFVLITWQRPQIFNQFHSLPSFIIRYGLLDVPCCLFWTQIGHTPTLCVQFVSRIDSMQRVRNWKERERMGNARKLLVAATIEKAKT